MYSTLQFCGNIEEYFAKNTKKLVVFVVLPRIKVKFNFLRVYKEGKLIDEKKVKFSENIFLYYFLWYFYYLFFVLKYFSRKEKFIVFAGHPISFFGMSLQKILRNVEFAYWIGDYFPPINITMVLFERLKKYYHDKVKFSYYLSDRINVMFNSQLMNTRNRKTVMWGIKTPPLILKEKKSKKIIICFIGVLRDSQGIEKLLQAVRDIKEVYLKILGQSTSNQLFNKYRNLIKEYQIENRVYFPNKAFYENDLKDQIKDCLIGIAPYEVIKTSATYYADPAKIKTYTTLGLPVIMTKISDIAGYIEKFGSGEVIEDDIEELKNAIIKIKKNYVTYLKGVKKFNSYFNYEKYYPAKFIGLENG